MRSARSLTAAGRAWRRTACSLNSLRAAVSAGLSHPWPQGLRTVGSGSVEPICSGPFTDETGRASPAPEGAGFSYRWLIESGSQIVIIPSTFDTVLFGPPFNN